jgi:predicted signal transduction protein with EAL and GGDEF domain
VRIACVFGASSSAIRSAVALVTLLDLGAWIVYFFPALTDQFGNIPQNAFDDGRIGS